MCFAFISGSLRFATLRAMQRWVEEVAGLADDSKQGRLSRGIKEALDASCGMQTLDGSGQQAATRGYRTQ